MTTSAPIFGFRCYEGSMSVLGAMSSKTPASPHEFGHSMARGAAREWLKTIAREIS